MRRILVLLFALLPVVASAQIADNKGRPIVACVPPDATAPGTFLVGDGSGSLNVIVDSGALTCSISQTSSANDVDVLTMPTTTVTATNLDVQIGGSDTVTVTATDLDVRNLNATDDIVQARGAAADGAAVVGNPNRIAGKDGSGNTQDIATDTSGELQVDVLTMPTTTVTATDLDIRNLNATDDILQCRGAAADGAAVAGNPNRIAGKDGSGNTQDIITDTSGELQVDVLTLPALVAGSANIGDVDVLTLPALVAGTANIGDVDVASFPDNEPLNVAQKGGAAIVAGPCEREAVLYAVIDQTSGEEIINGTASERIYICSIQLVTATAQNVALVDGTGSVCATGATGLLGGSTAATGWNFAANGGIVLPNNDVSWAKTSTDDDNVCLLQSGGGQISGSITYVSVPNI